MKILVTGISGFIGKHVYNRLIKTKLDFHVTSRTTQPNMKNCHLLDILNHHDTQLLMEKIKPDVLIHLAWDVTHGEFWSSAKNISYAEASINLFGSFLNHGGKKIIAAGTCAEYPAANIPVLEDLDYHGELSEYGKAKKTVCQFLNSCQINKAIDFTWFRIFGLFGPGEDERRFFPSVINAVRAGVRFETKNPETFFDYVYVDDLACFIVACINRAGLGNINIGTGNAIAMLDLYTTIEAYLKTNSINIIKTINKPSQNSRIPNCEKLQKNGFNFSLQNGLEQTNELP